MILVADAGPLIALGKLGRLDLLTAIADRTLVPRAVYHEVVIAGERTGRLDAFAVRSAVQRKQLERAHGVGEGADLEAAWPMLGAGEKEAIAVALDVGADAVLLDDLLARRVAKDQGLHVFGTLGIVTRSHRNGTIELREASALLHTLKRRPDIWISSDLIDQVLARIGEDDE